MKIERMSKEDLRSRLDNPDTVVIDVRRHKEKEKEKIVNAVPQDPDKTEAWIQDYPKDKTILLYCS